MNDTQDEEHVIRLTGQLDDPVVGAVFRPPRVLTAGRRRSDRWLTYCAIGLLGAQSLFTVWVGYQLHLITSGACP